MAPQKKPVLRTRPFQIYLTPDEQRMLNELRQADVRSITDTLRFALRQAYTARFSPTHPTQDAQQ